MLKKFFKEVKDVRFKHNTDMFICCNIFLRGDSLRNDMRGNNEEKEFRYERSFMVLGGIFA